MPCKAQFFLCPSNPPPIRNPSGFSDNYPSSDPSLPLQPSIRLSDRRPYIVSPPIPTRSLIVSPKIVSSSFFPPPTALTLPPAPCPSTPASRPSPAVQRSPESPDLEARERAFREAEARVAGFIARNREEDERRQAQLTARARERSGLAGRVQSAVEHPLRNTQPRPELSAHPTKKTGDIKNKLSMEKFRELQNSRKLQADLHSIS